MMGAIVGLDQHDTCDQSADKSEQNADYHYIDTYNHHGCTPFVLMARLQSVHGYRWVDGNGDDTHLHYEDAGQEICLILTTGPA
jgi:hypothetical protein